MKLTHILSRFFLTHILSNEDKPAGKPHYSPFGVKDDEEFPGIQYEVGYNLIYCFYRTSCLVSKEYLYPNVVENIMPGTKGEALF